MGWVGTGGWAHGGWLRQMTVFCALTLASVVDVFTRSRIILGLHGLVTRLWALEFGQLEFKTCPASYVRSWSY